MKSEHMLLTFAVRIVALLVMLSGLVLGVAATSVPVLAHGMHSRDTTGYSMSLVATSPDYYWGNNTGLIATLSYPASNPPTIVTGKSLSFSIDGQIYESSPNVSETSPEVIFDGATTTGGLLPGQHTVTATYTDLTTNAQVTSPPVILTVEKLDGNSALDCQTANFVETGQTMQFTVSLTYSFAASDWTNATITIQFVGPTTVVSAPQVIDSSARAQFSVSAPTPKGNYQIQCIFSGNNIYTPGQFDSPLTVSTNYALGAVNLYSNPTSLHLNTTNPFTLYIVLHSAGNLPPPTGQVYFIFELYTFGPGTLDSSGALLATFKPPAPLGTSFSTIGIEYMGDTNYGRVTHTFSQKNPPIPANTNGSGSSNVGSGSSGATATPNAHATATATVTAIATATPEGVTGASNTPTVRVSAAEGPNWALIVGLAVTVLALMAGGVGGFLLWRARRSRIAFPTGPSEAQSPYGSYGPYGQSSPYPQRDVGWNHTGAPTYPDQSQASARTPRYRPPADDAQW